MSWNIRRVRNLIKREGAIEHAQVVAGQIYNCGDERPDHTTSSIRYSWWCHRAAPRNPFDYATENRAADYRWR
jgi:hypothetical protein